MITDALSVCRVTGYRCLLIIYTVLMAFHIADALYPGMGHGDRVVEFAVIGVYCRGMGTPAGGRGLRCALQVSSGKWHCLLPEGIRDACPVRLLRR